MLEAKLENNQPDVRHYLLIGEEMADGGYFPELYDTLHKKLESRIATMIGYPFFEEITNKRVKPLPDNEELKQYVDGCIVGRIVEKGFSAQIQDKIVKAVLRYDYTDFYTTGEVVISLFFDEKISEKMKQRLIKEILEANSERYALFLELRNADV